MYSKALVNPCLAVLCRSFGDLSRWLAMLWPFGDRAWLCYLAMLCRPFGDLSRAWLCYVGPLVTLAVFGYVM